MKGPITSQSQYYTNLRSSSETPQDPYIHTQGGRFYINTPAWDPKWMAHSMAQTARYRGHADTFYSVAEHSVLVAALMRDVVGGDPFEGIMHDAAESVLPDVSSPFKQLLPDLRKVEKKLDKHIRQTFGLPIEKSQEATIADWLALFIEAAELIPERGGDFVDPYELRPVALELREVKRWKLMRLNWREAKQFARGVRAASSREVIPGHKVGTKRRDMRWLSPDGTEWDSKFEYAVFLGHKEAGLNVRPTTEQDSLLFTRPVRNGACSKCDSCEVVSRHRYTPDLYVGATDDRERGGLQTTGYYIEAKGYLRAEQRSLLRALRKARPDVDLRLIVQRDYKVTKQLTITEWARKYLRVRATVWSGRVPSWD